MIGWLMCLTGRHDWEQITHPRLLVLNDSWPPDYTDGLPGGVRFDCTRCEAKQVR